MAIPAASGYPQYSGNLIAPIVKYELIEAFYCTTVFGEISTTDYIGELTKHGDQITFFKEPDVVIQDHIKDGFIHHQTLELDTCTLSIDRAKNFSLKIAKVDEKQVQNIDMFKNSFMRQASRRMAEEIDRELLAEVTANAHVQNQGVAAGAESGAYNLGEVGNPVGITAANIVEVLTNVSSVLDEACVPMDSRYIVLPPIGKNVIMNSELRFANQTGMSETISLNGRMPTTIAGFQVYISQHLPRVYDPGVNAWVYSIPAGIRSSTVFASQMEATRLIEDKDSWDNYYQGLQVYGFDTIREEGLANLYARFA